ncbi:hypothetical protein J5834_00465 [bacterium]|nr:hypothetical protein [bacterium]
MFSTLLVERAAERLGIKVKLEPAIISGCYIDSRACGNNSLFFAFKGEKVDGHTFVPELLKRGVICVGTEDFDDKNYIKVSDTAEFMAALAKERRSLFKGLVLCVTGSSGKTSTRQLVASMLRELKLRVHATSGNLNNHLGMPLVILNMPLYCEALVLEIGMNHAGELKHLVGIAEPDFGAITNIGTAHIGNFGSQAELAQAKLEIFDYSHAVAVADISDPYISKWVSENEGKRKIVKYSKNELGNLAEEYSGLPDFMVENLLTAKSLVTAATGRMPDLRKSIDGCELPAMRGEIRTVGKRLFVVDCYNANPASMQKSIDNFLRRYTSDNVFILGSMFELGGFSCEMHRMILDNLIGAGVKSPVFLIGPEFDKIKNEYANQKNMSFFSDISEAAKYLPAEGNFLLKGSRGNRLETIFTLPEVKE